MLTVSFYIDPFQSLKADQIIKGNATTDDLWSALSEASKQDVNAFMVCIQSSCHLFPALNDHRIHGFV